MRRKSKNGTPKDRQTGLWIPNSILFNNELAAADKMLVSEIKVLQRSTGCYAGNAHFSQMLGVGERRVREMIGNLTAKSVLRVENGTSKRRRIFLGDRAEVPALPSEAAPASEASVSASSSAAAESFAASLQSAETVLDEPAVTRHQSATAGQETSNEPGRTDPSNQVDDAHVTRQETSTENTTNLHLEKKKREREDLERELGIKIPGAITPELWRQWVTHNASMGRRLSATQMEAQIAELKRIFEMGYRIKDTITQAIAGGWKTFYEPKASKHMRFEDFEGRPRRSSRFI